MRDLRIVDGAGMHKGCLVIVEPHADFPEGTPVAYLPDVLGDAMPMARLVRGAPDMVAELKRHMSELCGHSQRRVRILLAEIESTSEATP